MEIVRSHFAGNVNMIIEYLSKSFREPKHYSYRYFVMTCQLKRKPTQYENIPFLSDLVIIRDNPDLGFDIWPNLQLMKVALSGGNICLSFLSFLYFFPFFSFFLLSEHTFGVSLVIFTLVQAPLNNAVVVFTEEAIKSQ